MDFLRFFKVPQNLGQRLLCTIILLHVHILSKIARIEFDSCFIYLMASFYCIYYCLRDSQLASLFAKEFSSVPVDDSESLSEGSDDSLSQFLFHFSAPVTLSEMRGLYTDEVIAAIFMYIYQLSLFSRN